MSIDTDGIYDRCGQCDENPIRKESMRAKINLHKTCARYFSDLYRDAEWFDGI